MSQIHVLGGSGAVGGFLLERLRTDGHSVVAYSRRPRVDARADADLSWLQLDLWRAPRSCPATTIVSAGPLDGLVHWIERTPTPALTRLIALGSMSIVTKVDAVDPAEREIARRLQQAEQGLQAICEQRGIAWTLLRPTLIWGAGTDRSLNTLYQFGRRWRFVPMPRAMGGGRQPVHADDVAAACVQALTRDSSARCTIALGGAEILANRTMWSRVISAAEARPLRLPGPALIAASHLLGTRGRDLRATLARWQIDQLADNDDAMRILEWQPRGFAPKPRDFG